MSTLGVTCTIGGACRAEENPLHVAHDAAAILAARQIGAHRLERRVLQTNLALPMRGPHARALGEQALREVAANEARSSCDQYAFVLEQHFSV
jgi:hypothetical protein